MLKQGLTSGLSLTARSPVPYVCWSCEIRQLANIRARRTTLPRASRSLSTYTALRNGETPNDPTENTNSANPSGSNDAAPVTDGVEKTSSSHVREVLTDVPAKASQSPGKSKRPAKRRKTFSKVPGSIATAKAVPRRVKVKSRGLNKRQSKKAQQLRELIRKIQSPRQISELHELKEEGIPLGELPNNISMKDAMSRTPKGTKTSMINTGDVEFSAIDAARGPVPELAYGLSRVLFNQGITELRDVRTRVFNFDSYLDKLIPVKDFDFNTLGTFKTPSNDPVLAAVAAKSGKRFIGSTSSMTGMLKHFHYLISAWREPNLTKVMSREFPLGKKLSYTKTQKAPDAVFLRWKDGVYAIDADKEHDSPNILSMLGKYMEKLLTVPKATFEKHRVGQSHKLTKAEREVEDSYHYSTVDDFVIRSQLDAHDSRLPGTGMFDLKTRAVLPIRMSVRDHEWGMDYELKQRHGEFESYEREYHDMVRATMLKYSLQVRLGRMDGIFVAYHNIARIFGFQYIGLDELDLALHGQKDQTIGDQELAFSLRMLNEVFDKATKQFPEQSLRIHVETRPATTPFMYVFVEPVTEEQVTKVQNSKKALVEAYERKVLGLDVKEPSVEGGTTSAKNSSSKTVKVNSKRLKHKYEANKHVSLSKGVQQAVDNPEAHNPGASDTSSPPTEIDKPANDANKVDEVVQEAIEEVSTDGKASNQSVQELVVEKLSDSIESGDTQFLEKVAEKVVKVKVEHGPLLGYVVRARSFVDGQHVPRPEELTKDQTWTLQYTIAEIDNPERARSLYDAVIVRRKGLLGRTEEDDVRESDYFIDKLKAITAQSKKWREELDAADAARPSVEWNPVPAAEQKHEQRSELQEHRKRRQSVVESLNGLRKLAGQTQEDFLNMIKTVQHGYDGLFDVFKGLLASAGVKDRSMPPLEFGPIATPSKPGRSDVASSPASKSIKLDKKERHILDDNADRNISIRNITSQPEQSHLDPVLLSAENVRQEKVKTMADTVEKINAICSRESGRRYYGQPAAPGADPEFNIKDLMRTLSGLSSSTISNSAKSRPGLDEADFHREWNKLATELRDEITALKRSLAKEEITTKGVEFQLRRIFIHINKPFFGGNMPSPPTAQMEATFNVRDYSGVVTPSAFEAPKQPTNPAPGGSVASDAHHGFGEATSETNMPGVSAAEQDNVSFSQEEVDQNTSGTSVDSTSLPQLDVVEREEAIPTDMAVGTQTSLSDSDRNDAVSSEAEGKLEVDSDVSSSETEAKKPEDDIEAQVKSTGSVDEVTISVPTEQTRT